jgi:hypothetical protein
MSNKMSIDHDPTISVTIRTGTSQRRPQYNDDEKNMIQHIFTSPVTIPVTPPRSDFLRYRRTNLLDPFIYNNPRLSTYRALLELLSEREFYNVLEQSLLDGDLERNDDIVLNVEKRDCKQQEVNEECSICQTKYIIEDTLCTLPTCKHTFHHGCIMEWGKYKQECPLCRLKITTVHQ